MLTRRLHHRTQEGQVLIMALAFIVFFGLVTAAVLRFADTVELQQSHQRSATNEHADVAGAFLFAAVADLQLGGCPAATPVSIAVDGNVATIASCTPENLNPLYQGDCASGPYLDAVSLGSQSVGTVLVGANCTDGQVGGTTITGIISVDYGP